MIEKSYSKEGQDIFVDTLLDKGFFLDIGCGPPIYANNTYALELSGWTGILLDSFDQDCSMGHDEHCKIVRKSPVFKVDCNYIDWVKFLEENNVPKIIDYISLDVDDANICVINNFPFKNYEFKVMTFETDYYSCGMKRKEHAIKVLSQHNQYQMILEDGIAFSNDYYSCGMSHEKHEMRAHPNEQPLIWEDWWINTKFINIDCYYKNMYWFDFLKKLKKRD